MLVARYHLALDTYIAAHSTAQLLQAAKAAAATKGVLKARAVADYGKGTMLGSAAVLAVFPDYFSLWNVRREALGEQLSSGDDGAAHVAENELALTKKCLAEHPKSYAAWHQRRWVVSKGLSDMNGELASVEECAACITDRGRPVLRAVTLQAKMQLHDSM